MSSCCGPDAGAYREAFDPRRARKAAAAFRAKGLDRDSRRIVDFLEGLGLAGASVLDVGGGVGQLHLELLRRGAAHATSLELVDSYDEAGEDLTQELGLQGRVTRLHGDLATDPDLVGKHDFVVMHRVVCCYPDAHGLLASAGAHAERALVFSHPPRNLVAQAAVGAENLGRRLRGRSFRVFVHDPHAMERAAAAGGRLRPTLRHHGFTWDIAGFVAQPPPLSA